MGASVDSEAVLCGSGANLRLTLSFVAGEKVAQQRRMPGAKAYDFFVESSFVEVGVADGYVRR